jgi:hypothetical protein
MTTLPGRPHALVGTRAAAGGTHTRELGTQPSRIPEPTPHRAREESRRDPNLSPRMIEIAPLGRPPSVWSTARLTRASPGRSTSVTSERETLGRRPKHSPAVAQGGACCWALATVSFRFSSSDEETPPLERGLLVRHSDSWRRASRWAGSFLWWQQSSRSRPRS